MTVLQKNLYSLNLFSLCDITTSNYNVFYCDCMVNCEVKGKENNYLQHFVTISNLKNSPLNCVYLSVNYFLYEYFSLLVKFGEQQV